MGYAANTAFTASGEAWDVDPGGWIPRSSDVSLPVPASEVKLFDGNSPSNLMIITHSDEAWSYRATTEWVSVGTFPGSPTPTKTTSWGAVKGEFAR